jgi:NADH-quinone oxidoreductase subunit A
MDILLAPPAAFLIFLAVFYGLYRLVEPVLPKLAQSSGKLTSYTCGETVPTLRLKLGYRDYFFIALFFTMMHVAALVVTTLPGGPGNLFGLFYLGMISLSVAALIIRRKND